MKSKVLFQSDENYYLQDTINNFLLFLPPELSSQIEQLLINPEILLDECSSYYARKAKSLLDKVINAVSENIPLNLADGLLGIGWGFKYLSMHKFIKSDVNKILSDLDLKVMEISPARMHRYDLFYGFGGIVRYILCRLYSANGKNKGNNPFTPDFLSEVYNKSIEIIETGKYNNCPETYIEYILYYENRKNIDPPSVYDITVLPSWNEYSKKNKDLSLNGVIGFCLEFLSLQSINYNI